MEIRPSGSVPTRRQPKESFTGVVWQDPIIEAPAPARIRSGRVSFEPGARTAWHTHPLGQTLHVHLRRRARAGEGRADPRDPRRRHGLDPAGREALAWRRRRTPAWCTSPCRKRSTASMSSGWNTSPTRNIRSRSAVSTNRYRRTTQQEELPMTRATRLALDRMRGGGRDRTWRGRAGATECDDVLRHQRRARARAPISAVSRAPTGTARRWRRRRAPAERPGAPTSRRRARTP